MFIHLIEAITDWSFNYFFNYQYPKLGSEAVVMGSTEPKVVSGPAGYVLEDVPHLSDYIPNLPVRRRFSPLLFSYAILLHQEKKSIFFYYYFFRYKHLPTPKKLDFLIFFYFGFFGGLLFFLVTDQKWIIGYTVFIFLNCKFVSTFWEFLFTFVNFSEISS